MKFLIDTNIFIPLEPVAHADLEAGTPAAIEFARLASETGNQLYVHPVTRVDIRRDVDDVRRKVREILFKKYPRLPNPPPISSSLEQVLGRTEPQTNEWVDNHLISALEVDAVDFLVTEDRSLRKKARRLGLEDRVATVAEALSILRDLYDIAPMPPPAVQAVKAHTLNEADPIFKSFREDYPGFDAWLTKCKREHRQTWVIEVEPPRLAAVSIVKREKSVDFGVAGKILKLCSFKVSEEHNGFRFGELLLKTAFDYASANRYEWIYVTVFDKYGNLIRLLEDFGFQDMGQRTNLGELILAKPMSFTEADRDSHTPLEFNIRYGPFATKIKGVPAFVVPIKPKYHRLLFPETEQQLELMPGRQPFGNSIRKAYLSNAAIRTIARGANLLFYRSEDIRSVTCLGVVEDTLVSNSAIEIARCVGKRTVYKFAEIEALCQKEVLAILFRQSRVLKEPIPLKELIANGVLSAAPQSILTVPEGATEWLQTRLNG